MQKIISYTVDDLAVNPSDIAAALDDACKRGHDKYKVQGVCQFNGRVYFILLPLLEGEPVKEHVLVSADETSHDDVVALLNTRWAAGFDTLSTIRVYDTTYVLYTKQAEKSS